MAIEPTDIATHGGAGFLGAVLTFFGLRDRIVRLEEKFDNLPSCTVSQQSHEICNRSTHQRFDAIDIALREIHKDIKGLKK